MTVNIFYNAPLPKYYRVNAKYKAAVLKALGKYARTAGEVNLVIAGVKEMRRVNKQFLNHDYVTDTIAFSYHFAHTGPGSGAELPFGDIFICFEQAKKHAAQQGHSALAEMLVLAAHGALHLAGHNDNTPEKRAAMNNAATKIAKDVLYAR